MMPGKNKITSPVRSQAGLSMVELLATLLIATLVSIIMATGVPTAFKAYQRAMDAANAWTLLSATTTALRSELSVADPESIVVTDAVDGNPATIVFTSKRTGYQTTLYSFTNDSSSPAITECVVDEVTGEEITTVSEELPLVAEEVGRGSQIVSLTATVGSFAYSDGVFTVNNVQIKREGEAFADAEVEHLKIKVIAAS